jgi:hypothetical protein
VQVGLVIFVFPRRTATVTAVLGDGDLAVAARLFAVEALHQFGVTGGAAPVTLDAGAGVAHRLGLQFSFWIQVLGHMATFKENRLSLLDQLGRVVPRARLDAGQNGPGRGHARARHRPRARPQIGYADNRP